ncbi:hypothetical protein c109 [Metallosphaera turreted icosahedral virus]|uniref:hypothetical protein c109 n=1 Tax=Metallosphaera turreted icosahedral virus TaxID=2023155 RepID=UPI000B8D528F|nr:hypothetical protein c109 [Metallosphaera turreted icosahedral virus]ASO67386.1 hypothetical protein c109 [Metallosphaera turreted icosahedral virus]
MITLDHDVPYDGYRHSAKGKLVVEFCKSFELRCWYRRSSTGNVHVAIDVDVDFLRELEIRAVLLDDPMRILNDLRRHAFHMPTGRLWDVKVDREGKRQAGQWEVLFSPE